MSLATWKKEFYKTPAHRVSKRFAAKHSLRKWIGLKKSNLKKHGVMIVNRESVINIADKEKWDGFVQDEVKSVEIDESTCSLCANFADTANGDDICAKCPLCKMGKTCGEENSPYDLFLSTGNVGPMVKALEKIVKAGQ